MQIKLEGTYKDPKQLTPNKLNQQVYGTAKNEAFEELLKNVKVNGILQALVITEAGMVRSGNLRLEVALALGMKLVPCIIEKDTDELYKVQLVKNKEQIIDDFKTMSHNLRRAETPYSILCKIQKSEEYFGIVQGGRSDKNPDIKKGVEERRKLASGSKQHKLKTIQSNLETIFPGEVVKQQEYWGKVGEKLSVNGAFKETKILAVKSTEVDTKEPFNYLTNQIKIYNQSCLDLSIIPDKSVKAIVSSPPYYKKRTHGHDNELGQEATVDLYVQNLVAVFKNCIAKLKDEGSIWVNLGDSVINGQYAMAPEKFMIKMVEAGFIINDMIHWVKDVAQYCDGRRSTRNFEYLFQFTLNKNYYHDQTWLNTTEGFEDNIFGEGTRIKLSSFLRLKDGIVKTGASNTMLLREACKNESFHLDHSSTFPPEVPFLCIKNSCIYGDTVVDLFNGCGNTAKAVLATNMNIKYIGYELNPIYVKASKINIELNISNEVSNNEAA